MSYTYIGEQFPSVSKILGQLDKSGALIPWALNCFESKLNQLLKNGVDVDEAIITAKKSYRDVSSEALDIGTQVHDAIERYIKTGKDLSGELKPEVANGFIAFLEWESEHVSKWIECEVRTINYEVGYAGTYDGIFLNKDGDVVMIDFKTSKAIYDEYWMQVSAYREARMSLAGKYEVLFERGQGAIFKYDLPEIRINRTAILRLDKVTGMPEYIVRDRAKMFRDYMAFEKLVEFFYAQKNRRLKNNHIVESLKRSK